jgi:serine/threonine protein kinase
VATCVQFSVLTEAQALLHGKRIADALNSLHDAGYVHCDCKVSVAVQITSRPREYSIAAHFVMIRGLLSLQPSNCFVDAAGDVFLGDFGAVVKLGEAARETSQQWLPVDQADGLLRCVSPAVDHIMLVSMLALAVGALPQDSCFDVEDSGGMRALNCGMGVPRQFGMSALTHAVDGVQHAGLRDFLRGLLCTCCVCDEAISGMLGGPST